METSLIDQGVSLMLYGMGTVFVFLTILVFATNLMSKVVNHLTPEQTKSDSPPELAMPVATPQSMPKANVITAIEKAIAEHRASK